MLKNFFEMSNLKNTTTLSRSKSQYEDLNEILLLIIIFYFFDSCLKILTLSGGRESSSASS